MINTQNSRKIAVVILLIAIVQGSFLRFFRINELPPGFSIDEVRHALEALDILGGKVTLISTYFQQLPTGYMILLAGVFKLFGAEAVIQRMLTATFGVILLPINYLTVKHLFKGEAKSKSVWIATFSTVPLAASFWAVSASRLGYEYILTAVFALTATFLVWRSYWHNKWFILFVAAIFTNAGFYFYEGAAPFILVIATTFVLHELLRRLISKFSSQPSQLRWKALLFYTLSVFFIALPLLIALVGGSTPEASKTLDRLIIQPDDGLNQWVGALSKSIADYARAFLALPPADEEWLLSVQNRHPILSPVLAPFFLLGMIICFIKVNKLPYLFVLTYFWGMAAPSILTYEGIPHHFRISGALPATFMFIGISWAELYFWSTQRLTTMFQNKPRQFVALSVLTPFLLIGLVWLPFQTYQLYFLHWAKNPKLHKFFNLPTLELVQRLEQVNDPKATLLLLRPDTESEKNHIIDFFFKGQMATEYLVLDEKSIRTDLTSILKGQRKVYIIETLEGGREKKLFDLEHTSLPVLLEKYGRLDKTDETDGYTLLIYELDSGQVDFTAHLQPDMVQDFTDVSHIFADRLQLAGLRHQLEAQALQVDLAWQLQNWIQEPYNNKKFTVFVHLVDAKNQKIAGEDKIPERDFDTLDLNEVMVTQHSLTLSQPLTSGSYNLVVGIYYFVGAELVDVGQVTLNDIVTIK